VHVFSKTLAELVTLLRDTDLAFDFEASRSPQGWRGRLGNGGHRGSRAARALEGDGYYHAHEHAPVEYFLIINEKVWKSLSPTHQSLIAQVAKIVERQTREKVSEIESAAYTLARQKGMKVLELTPDQVAEWRACSSGVLGDYMDNGGLADRLMAAYGKLRTDPCCTAGPSTGPFGRR